MEDDVVGGKIPAEPQQPPEQETEGNLFERLNRQFYSSSPASYFRARFHMLFLLVGRPEALDALLAEGVEWEGLTARIDLAQQTTEDVRHQAAFVLTESQALFHHATEALIRLFIAHADLPACPWFEVASMRSPVQLRGAADELARAGWTARQRVQLEDVFLPGASASNVPEQKRGLEALERLMRSVAQRLNADANMYNSVKHGMTVVAGASSFGVLKDDGSPAFGTTGESVTFLESEFDEEQRKWSQTTLWLDVRQTLWLTDLVIAQIEGLWQVARCRYLGEELDGVRMVTPEAVAAAFTGAYAARPSISRASFSVATERSPKPPKKRKEKHSGPTKPRVPPMRPEPR